MYIEFEAEKINKLLKVRTKYTKSWLKTWKTSLQSDINICENSFTY